MIRFINAIIFITQSSKLQLKRLKLSLTTRNDRTLLFYNIRIVEQYFVKSLHGILVQPFKIPCAIKFKMSPLLIIKKPKTDNYFIQLLIP